MELKGILLVVLKVAKNKQNNPQTLLSTAFSGEHFLERQVAAEIFKRDIFQCLTSENLGK